MKPLAHSFGFCLEVEADLQESGSSGSRVNIMTMRIKLIHSSIPYTHVRLTHEKIMCEGNVRSATFAERSSVGGKNEKEVPRHPLSSTKMVRGGPMGEDLSVVMPENLCTFSSSWLLKHVLYTFSQCCQARPRISPKRVTCYCGGTAVLGHLHPN